MADASRLYIGGVFSSMTGVPSGNLAAVTLDAGNPCPVISLAASPLPGTVAGTAYTTALAASGGAAMLARAARGQEDDVERPFAHEYLAAARVRVARRLASWRRPLIKRLAHSTNSRPSSAMRP